jgi:hypothetical protein
LTATSMSFSVLRETFKVNLFDEVSEVSKYPILLQINCSSRFSTCADSVIMTGE